MVAERHVLAGGKAAEVPVRTVPAPLPTAADCPRMLCCREVVRHPQGGWTIARPIDATKTTARIYAGHFPTRRAAQAVVDTIF